MWTMLLVMASGAQTIGAFDSYEGCSRAIRDFRSQGVTAVCVQQQDPAQQLGAMLHLFGAFIREMERRDR